MEGLGENKLNDNEEEEAEEEVKRLNLPSQMINGI